MKHSHWKCFSLKVTTQDEPAYNGVESIYKFMCKFLCIFMCIYVQLYIYQHCDVVVFTTAQLHSTKSRLRFPAGSNPARGVSEIRDSEDL